jgi:uncharacterized protein YrrD
MENLGDQVSYLVLAEGTPVYSSDGAEVGRVGHVLGDEQKGIFDGLVIRRGIGRHGYVDADHVAAVYERGVVLKVDAAGVDDLPEPSANPTPVIDGMDLPGMREKLMRAWDRINGRGM